MRPSLNQVALINGAATAEGAAIARALSRQRRSVALVDSELETIKALAAELVAEGGKSVAIACEAGDAGGVRSAVAEAQACLGPIAILVHCGSAGRPARELVLFSRELLSGMRERGFGRIVTIFPARGGEMPEYSGLAGERERLLGSTRDIAAQCQSSGITCNLIMPREGTVPASPEQISSWIGHLISEQGDCINGASIPLSRP
ncbi:MAG: SDR family oxidoreductase [Oligoflexia bacterium]|nr:SDR family oxidoreductase [Oligoflexia bacterium]